MTEPPATIGEFPEVIASDNQDNIVRCMWAGRWPADQIREVVSPCHGLSIGVIGHRVKALELPVRDHNLQVLPTQFIDGPVHPLQGNCPEEEE